MNFADPYEPRDARHNVGDPVRFVPKAFSRIESCAVPTMLSGRVIYVNESHRYYTVEAECNGVPFRESFKF